MHQAHTEATDVVHATTVPGDLEQLGAMASASGKGGGARRR